MINPQIVISTLAAIVGVGGAYASVQTDDNNQATTVYNWYTALGSFKMTATLIGAERFGCSLSGPRVCLKGTVGNRHVTFFMP